MRRNFKILLISLFLSIPFWLGINVFARESENFWYTLEMSKNPEVLTATLNREYIEKKLERIKSDNRIKSSIEESQISSRASLSVRVRGDEQRIIFESNSGDQVPIASITKLMTALVAIDNYDYKTIIEITKQAADREGNSRYGNILAGEKLTVESLLHIMLIESSNDAAWALTDPIGDEPFIDLMNLYAKELGLDSTYFINPNGLDPEDPASPKNYSSARDLVKLSRHILAKYPQIFEITRKDYYQVKNPDGSIHHLIRQSTNKLLAEELKTKIIGGKTGWTQLAGGCLLLILEDPETKDLYFNVVLGALDRFTEMRKIINAIN